MSGNKRGNPMFQLFLVFALAFLSQAFPLSRPSPRQPLCHASSPSNDEEPGNTNESSRSPIDTLRSRASEGAQSIQNAASSLSNLEKAGRNTVKSAGGATWSGATQLASQGSSGVQNAASSLSNLEKAGRNTVKSAAGATWSGATQLASQGSSGVQSAAQFTGSRFSGLAKTASITVGSAGSSLVGMAQQGTSTATNLVQWLDTQAKDGTAASNAKAQDVILGFTGKSEYQFGDISKEVVRRASSTDVDVRDILLLLKVLLTLGATITPLAKLLPITVLLEMLNVSLETRLGGKILEAMAGALDERLLAAFSADELGDLAKRSLNIGITSFTGMETYKKGDIEKTIKEMDDSEIDRVPMAAAPQPTTKTLNLMVGPEFAEWDQNFLQETSPTDLETVVEQSLNNGCAHGRVSSEELDKEFVSELDEWDEKFRALYPEKQR